MLPRTCHSTSTAEDAAVAGDFFVFFFKFLSFLPAALSAGRRLPAPALGHGVHVGRRCCSSSFLKKKLALMFLILFVILMLSIVSCC